MRTGSQEVSVGCSTGSGRPACALAALASSSPRRSRGGLPRASSGAERAPSPARVCVAALKPVPTPTWCRTPASSFSPSRNEPTPSPSLSQRKPPTTQSAVRCVLHLQHLPLVLRGSGGRAASPSPHPGPPPRSARTMPRRPSWLRVAGREMDAEPSRPSAPARAVARARSKGELARSSSPSASRSKATNEAGVSSASFRMRLCAGWIRLSSASKSSPPGPAMTISPSTTQRSGQLVAERLDELREVAGDRPLVAAPQLQVLAVAEHHGAKPIPLRLVEHVVARGQLAGELREHRRDRGHHRKAHHLAAR